MKRNVAILWIICCVGFLLLFYKADMVSASERLLPKAHDNLEISLRKKSGLTATDEGYMRVFYDGEKVGVEYYDEEFNIADRKSIAMELDIWGGFYAGESAYYLVEGQNNTEENDSAEVIRVIKYDKSWNKIGAANITGNTDLFGGEVRYPFNSGCVEMTECNGILYIVTGHEGYVDGAYGQGHQGFLMIAVDESSMTGEIVDSDLGHSFAQYVEHKDSNLYVLEQSEGARCTALSKYDVDNLESVGIPVLEYGGSRTSAWAVACYASVDGMALSSDNVLCIGTSIDQSKYEEVTSDMSHNIYLTVTPMSDFTEEATTVKWLTNFNGGGESFLGVKITKINDHRFMISWEVAGETGTASDDDTLSENVLHYVFVDGNGNVVSDEFTVAAPISECQPIVKNSKVIYYASSSNMLNFYIIDAQDGSFSKKEFRLAGDHATWNLSEGILTISGTGPVNVNTEANYRVPISSTSGGFVYSSSDNSWEPIRDRVEKIVIETGITSISNNAFTWFDNLTEVTIESGVESIGEKAFYSCEKLRKITIPSSVTMIGADILWTGFYWIGDDSHVVYATIYTEENSYAVEYAKENNIRVEVFHEYGDWKPYDENQHIRVCECGESEYEVHSWTEWTTTKEATYAEAGEKVRTCEVCKEEEIYTIPKIELPFIDVKEGKYYYNAVLWAIEKEITTGISATTFCPNEPCTRGQVVTFLWRAYGCPQPKAATCQFTDVKENSYYYTAMLWAVENEITTGLSATQFSPNEPCTRGQIVTFLWRSNGEPKPTETTNKFVDVVSGSYYETAVLWAVENEITTGMTATQFSPDISCTRGQVVTFLDRAVN